VPRRPQREARDLFERYDRSGDPRARELLVRRYTPLARHLAARYACGGEPFEDLFQVACLGLLKAIDRFDCRRGAAFTSFAVPTIVGELKRHFRDATWVVHVPHSVHDLAMRVRWVTLEETQRLGREPSAAELADMLDADEQRVAAALAALAAYQVASLEAPCDADGPDHDVGAEDGGFSRIEQQAELDDLIGCLSAGERQILRLRFEDDLTQRQIGDLLGVSQVSVSRILRRSLGQLRATIERRGLSMA
jgi:RNA polymerase sigma-B factor